MRKLDAPPGPGVVNGGDRPVEVSGDHPVLSDQSLDDTDWGWGERTASNDDRLLAERPPHWD